MTHKSATRREWWPLPAECRSVEKRVNQAKIGEKQVPGAVLRAASRGIAIGFLGDEHVHQFANGLGRPIQARFFPVQLLDSLEDHLGDGELEVGNGAGLRREVVVVVVASGLQQVKDATGSEPWPFSRAPVQ